ncbi:hypothetical protein M406DRAFT_320901, partial [Cryphonectria parasitica EP155]
MNLDGAPAPLPLARISRTAPVASSNTGSRARGPTSVVTFNREDQYPNEQPWRRPVREGDFAGAIDPN